jgi:hypothetical protein
LEDDLSCTGLEAEYWEQVDFLYLDRELPQNLDVVRFFGVTYQPVFILLSPEGIEISRWFTPHEEVIREQLTIYLNER